MEPNQKNDLSGLIEYVQSLGWDKMQPLVTNALKATQKAIKEQTTSNFYALPIKHSSPKGLKFFKKKDLAAALIFKDDVNGTITGTSSILRTGVYKWFEVGTGERHQYASIGVKGHSTGKLKGYHFFKQALDTINPEQRFFEELDKQVKAHNNED